MYDIRCDLVQLLNAYADELRNIGKCKTVSLEFLVRRGDGLQKVHAELPSTGSLGPLFLAFGLITMQEYKAGAGQLPEGMLHLAHQTMQ